MLQLFDNKYPYTDFHELNLDWIISRLIQMDHKLTNFVSLNTIKYADPIEWNIASQYGTNTVVVDPATGIAYLSTQPVPAGVSIGDPAYWTEIFNLQQIIGNITDNLTLHNNGQSPTLLFPVSVGDWILWNNKLYVATADMVAGTALIVGSNIDEANVEDLTKYYTDAVRTNLVAIIGALADLQTSDTSSIVNAINSVLSDTAAIIGDLNDLTTTDKTSIVNAINETVVNIGNLDAKVGDLANLTTSDTTSIVNAINSLKTHVDTEDAALDNRITQLENKNTIYYNVKNYGATGDGTTNDTAAVQLAVADANLYGGIVYFPVGQYKITSTLTFTRYGTGLMGENAQGTYLLIHHNGAAVVFGDGINTLQSCYVAHIGIVNHGVPADGSYGVFFNNVVNSIMFDVIVAHFKRCFGLNHAGNCALYSCCAVSNVAYTTGFFIYNKSVSTIIDNCYVPFIDGAVDTGCGLSATVGDVADLCIRYFDVGNGSVGILINGADSPAEYPPADIRIYDPVLDGMRHSCIQLESINIQGNVLIEGGWLNPLPNGTACGIRLTSTNNTTINGTTIQQLANEQAQCYGIICDSCPHTLINACKFINLITDISLANGCRGSVISACIFEHYGTTTKNYNITATGSIGVCVTGNIFDSTGVGVVNKDSDSIYWIICANTIFDKTGTLITIVDSTDKIGYNTLP